MIVLVPLIVAIAGLLLYGFAANPKLQRIGEIMFFDGLFVTLLVAASSHIRLLPL